MILDLEGQERKGFWGFFFFFLLFGKSTYIEGKKRKKKFDHLVSFV
jgi:hypothetical protein